MKKTIMAFLLITVMVSCSHKNHVYSPEGGSSSVAYGYPGKESKSNGSQEVKPVRKGLLNSSPVNVMPETSAFRMNGDFADNVAVTLGPDGELLYFPAPTDITADSKPISLGDGWWLNCQGLGQNSVFTKYTFAQYAELPQTPSPEQLKMAIIPGAKVTEFKLIPMQYQEALQNLDAVKEYLK